MNLYHAYYKRQYYDEETKTWDDTYYDRQAIVVIADSLDNAMLKIEECLTKVELGKWRAVLVGDVYECVGLDLRHGFEDSFYVIPIV